MCFLKKYLYAFELECEIVSAYCSTHIFSQSSLHFTDCYSVSVNHICLFALQFPSAGYNKAFKRFDGFIK
jgi:hypothetical protein